MSSHASSKAPPTTSQKVLHRGRQERIRKVQRRRKRKRSLQKGLQLKVASGVSERHRQKNGTKTMQNEIGTKRDGMEVQIDKSETETVVGMEAWEKLGVPLPIIRALKELGFTLPTEIQRQAIPIAMDTDHDVIGAAETVSLLGIWDRRKCPD